MLTREKWNIGMGYLKVNFLKIAGLALGLCLFGTSVQAQTYGALYTTSQKAEKVRISEGMALEQALAKLEQEFNVVFLYRTDAVQNKNVANAYIVPNDVEKALAVLLDGQELDFKYLNPKTYGIYTVKERTVESKASIFQQVGGVVTDASTGETLPGVNIAVKGATTGTSTDSDGRYGLNVPSLSDTLLFSFIGYQTQEIPINGRTEIDVALQPQAITGEEIVVVGFGEQEKATLTGSVTSVQTEEVESVPTPNVVTGLAGKLPGLNITQRTGEPGSYTTAYNIRGFGNPLIVIDGIVRDHASFVRLDPKDVESISVLKDASAAVYGVKAANGVIVVTTKKGKMGKPQISYTSNFEWQEVTNAPEVGNAYQFAVLTTENEINGGRAPDATTYSPEDLQKFKDGTYPSTDWYEVVARDYTSMHRHNLNISGGSERIRYYNSLGFLNNEGLWKSGDLNHKKFTIRSNVTGYVTDNLEAELFLDGMWENKNEPSEPAWNIFKFTWMNKPTLPVYANNNPEYLQNMGYPWNPLAMSTADIGGYNKTKTKHFQGNISLNYDFPFFDGLSGKLRASYYTQSLWRRTWNKRYEVYDYNEVTDTYELGGIQNDPSNLTGYYWSSERISLMGQLTYQKQFLGVHNVKATLVFEERQEQSENLLAQKQFNIDIDQFYAGTSENQQINSSGLSEQANQNAIGRLNYDYRSKYLLEVGFNYGGSSLFPEEKRWGLFPFISAGWRLSEESFIKKSVPAITDLKIRASWGEMGDDGASSFQFLTGYNYPSGNYIFDGEVVSGLGFRGMPNPNITWYTVTTKNVGIDLDIHDGLFSAQVDLFQRDRSGLLATRILTIPGTVGAELPQENLNKDMRRGIELVVGHSKRSGAFQYDISANVTYTRGQAIKVERAPDANSYLNWRNNPVNRWDNITWGYHYTGQFQSYEDIYNSPIQDGEGNRTLRPGDLKYEDINKDGIISSLDLVPIARSHIPDINYGLNIRASWKQLDMSVLLQGAANFNFQYIEQLKGPLPWGRNSLTMFMDRWHHEDIYDADSPWVPGKYPATNYPPSNLWNSEFWWPDASYLRLKSLEAGYTLDQLLGSTGIQMRIFASGFNLFTWSRLKYVDPEKDPNTYNYLYPLMRIYNLGVNIKF